MKIKVTAGELTVMVDPLRDLTTAKMPSGVGYLVARLAQKLEKEIQLVVTRQAEIMRKYKAVETEEGNLKLTTENLHFTKARLELNDLFAQEITIDASIVMIPRNIILEPGTLLLLDKFVQVTGT